MNRITDVLNRHGLLLGALLLILGVAGTGVALLGSTGCTATQAGNATRGADVLLSPIDLPAVNDPALHGWMQQVAKRFDELAARDAQIEGEAKAPRNLSFEDWIFALLGIGTTGGGAVLAARSMHGKNAERIASIANAILGKAAGGASVGEAEHELRQLVEQLPRSKGGRKHKAAGPA